MTALAIINPRKRRKAGRKAKRRSNPVARKRKARATVRVRKAKRGRGRVITVRTKNPAKRRRSARRRNPAGLNLNSIKGRVLPAITGAVGAMIVDKGFDMLGDKLPAALQSGWGRVAAKAGVALLAGYALEKTKVLDATSRTSLIAGSLTVIAYQAIQSEVMPMVSTGFSTAPAPATVKGYSYGNLMGYQSGTLREMPNSGLVMPMGVPANSRRQFS